MSGRGFRSDAVYEASDGDAGELMLAIRTVISGLGAPDLGRVFSREGESWERWVKGGFVSVYGVHLLEVARLAAEGQVREIEICDRRLGEWLKGLAGNEVLTASQDAGREILESMEGAKSLKVCKKLLDGIESGRLEGHFGTVFAVRSQALHVSTRGMLSAFSYCAWLGFGRGRRLPSGVSEAQGFLHDGEDVGLDLAVGEVLKRSGSGNGGGLVACA